MSDARWPLRVRDFVQDEFVGRSMMAAVAYHDRGEDTQYAHILLTTLHLTKDGFGKKDRNWNSKDFLARCREEWPGWWNGH